MTKDEALKLALEFLEALGDNHWNDRKQSITAIQAALAQPEQEPVAWRTFDGEGGYEYRAHEMNEQYAQEWEQRNPNHKGWVEPLYTTPPQRKPLTDEKIYSVLENLQVMYSRPPTTDSRIIFARAIEAAHGIKGDA